MTQTIVQAADAPDAVPVRRVTGGDLSKLIDREWLVTNGLGGYASGTVCGAATRRYHGLLIAAHPAPLGRVMMLDNLTEQFRFADYSSVKVGGTEKTGGTLDVHGADMLTEFRLEFGLPVWRYESHGHAIEKRVYMPSRRNTVHVRYRLLGGPGPVRLKLRPSVHFRGHDDPVSTPSILPYTLTALEDRYEVAGGLPGYPTLRMRLDGAAAALTLDGVKIPDVLYRIEESRGYDGIGTLYSPGEFRVYLRADRDVVLTASTETWERMLALDPAAALDAEVERRRRRLAAAHPACRDGFAVELVFAADQFLISPASRAAEAARAQAVGDEARTVIAGYHWFTDWGRDTMISLEGLALVTGRHTEAGYILRTFASHVKDGLIPNFFPDRGTEGLYHTADATLWFFHAVARYVDITGDRNTLRDLLPVFKDILAHHMKGTRFGIGVDPKDGLLRQGAEGYQLTWMDAKVGDWVVTPRRGKVVEICALWYNALRLMEGWLREKEDPQAEEVKAVADLAYRSFNERFWRPDAGTCYDVIDGPHGDDPACRPNQLLAISLPHPVLAPEHWKPVLDVARERLLTPVGLRSLAPGEPEFKAKYYGDLRARDAAYHQGTVWAWLIGPYIDAWVKVRPDRRAECRELLTGFEEHLSEACVGTISEIFDAEPPYTSRGCVAQAWSVAEVLRCWAVVCDGCQE